MPIGPATVATGFDGAATRVEQQKKVWKNPRGLGYYYALFEIQPVPGGWVNYFFYKSSDGLAWVSTGVRLIDAAPGVSFVVSPSLCIWEDVANARLVFYVASEEAGNDLRVEAFSIADGASNPAALWNRSVSAGDWDQFPSICLDSSGYIWVTWNHEWTNKGKQRNKLVATRSDATYPIVGPGWETIVDVYGETGSVDYPDGIRCNSGPYLKTEVVPLTATANVGVVFSYYHYTGNGPEIRLKACTLNYTAQIDKGAMVPLDDTIHADLIHSSVAETGVNSDVFIGYKDSGGEFDCLKWDVSADSSAAYGTIFASTVDSLAISIDKNAAPDKLYCFYVKTADNTDFHYNITEVDAFSLEGETEVDDGSAEALDYLSASYQDWDLDGDVQVIYTRQTNFTVRFWAVGLPPAPPPIEENPLIDKPLVAPILLGKPKIR